jgi:hypothetical protein
VKLILQPDDSTVLSQDDRWALVKRIVASPAFVKSERLRTFLTLICELTFQGRTEEINEVNLAALLFNRPHYDPSIDGIVRSHASRLRQRLDQYFNQEGSEETIRLSIPKGAYIPVFEPHFAQVLVTAEIPPTSSVDNVPPTPSASRITLWALYSVLILACACLVSVAAFHAVKANQRSGSVDNHPFWKLFLGPGRHTMVVCSDTSLAILQDVSGQHVVLPQYLDGHYRTQVANSNGATADILKDIAGRRYTSIVDVGSLTRLYQMPGIHPERIQFRFARDLRPDDLKDSSTILLGAQQSNPWVGLFEPHMNFVFQDDLRRRIFTVINRSPKNGELGRYDYDQADLLGKVFGVAAFRSDLSGSGRVLILEGTSMAGTEAAVDFILDDGLLLPFLEKIRKADGSLPYFEVLLQSSNMNGNASLVRIVAYRTSLD